MCSAFDEGLDCLINVKNNDYDSKVDIVKVWNLFLDHCCNYRLSVRLCFVSERIVCTFSTCIDSYHANVQQSSVEG